MSQDSKPVSRWQRWLAKPFIVQVRTILAMIETRIEGGRDALIDAWYRFDFGGTIPADALVSDHKAALLQSTAYGPVTGRLLRIMISEAQRNAIDFKYFVDIGAGKGKACIYAAREFSFPTVLGVEFSPPLVAIAQANALKAGTLHATFVVADGTTYDLPAADTLVFLYNPFEEVAMEAFIVHNLDHFRAHRSLIAYGNDRHRRLFVKFGFETVYRDQILKLSIYRLPAVPG